MNYGAISMFIYKLGKILVKKDFDYCIVCWDGEGSGVMRWQHYSEYKANRDKNYALHDPNLSEYDKKLLAYERKVLEYAKKKRQTKPDDEDEDESYRRQKAILQAILDELCIRQFEFENVEGDDIISQYVHMKNPDEKVVIVSGDKDIAQLISDTVIIYNPNKRDFITKDNSVKMLGIRHDNIVLEKIICGDTSDNIKGVKGVGETTLRKLIPELLERKIDLSYVIDKAKKLNEERAEEKKKPLASLTNIVEGVTDGVQKDKLYEINEKIISLDKPMLTEEARKTMSDEMYAPIDTSERSVKNAYKIINDNKMYALVEENSFGNALSPFSRIILQEQKRYKNAMEN